MASSLHTGYIAHAADNFTDYYPIASAPYHDTLDSLRHLFDEYAQVRVNWPVRSSGHYTAAGGTTITLWYPLLTFAFPISLRSDGTSFRLRVRLTAAQSAANSGTFRAVLSSLSSAGRYANATADGGNVFSGATASTTPVVLTPASSDIIYMDTDMVREAVRDVRGYNAVSGAEPVDVAICDVALTIWSKTSNAAATSRIFGVYGAEYIGT